MSSPSEDKSSTGEMTVITEPVGRKDETYHWFDNVEFLVEDVRFWLPQYPFHVGSRYFVEKYDLVPGDGLDRPEGIVELKGVTAAQFRVFLNFLLPVHLTSTTITFTKEEWLTILTLSTLWHFHEAPKVAIQQLDGQLTEAELIAVGRAESIPHWVLAGYKSIVRRPNGANISDDEAGAIARHDYRAIHHLWAIRYQLALSSNDIPDDEFVERELLSKFEAELDGLATVELEHRTKAEIERDTREVEERRILEEEEQAAAEREEVERVEEARRRALEKLAEDERAKEGQIRLREEMGSMRYEQRLLLGEALSAIEVRIAACLQKSEETAQTLDEIRAGRAKCKCSRMIRKEISTLQGDVAALGEEVAQVAREEESMRAQEENQGGLIPTPPSDVQPGHPVL